jgi:hypothetical protein
LLKNSLFSDSIHFYGNTEFLSSKTTQELRDLYSVPSTVRVIKGRKMRWAGYVARMGQKRNSYGLSVGKPDGKRPLGCPRHRRVNNIRRYLGEVGWGDVD